MTMPLDPLNAPFQRAAPYRQDDTTTLPGGMATPNPSPLPGSGRAAGQMPAMPMTGAPMPGAHGSSVMSAPLAGEGLGAGVDVVLKAENILLEEFNNASASAYQAKEESGNLFNLYLLAVGALATGLGVLVNSYSERGRLTVTLVETLVLAISSIFSFAFFVRHLDLGQEYAESMMTMDVIKEFYIQRLKLRMPDIDRAFSRRLTSGKRSGPLGRGATVMGFTVALMGSFAVAGAVGSGRQLWAIVTNHNAPYMAELSVWGLEIPYFWEILAALLTLLIHLLYQRASSVSRRNQQRWSWRTMMMRMPSMPGSSR